MQTSLDLFVCDETGSTEGFIWNWEPDWKWDIRLQREFIGLIQSVDCVLLSRKMADEGFIDYWHSIAAQDANPASTFARDIDLAEKVVFSRTRKKSSWPNATLASSDFVQTIVELKESKGKTIIAYGGVEFASELITSGLIDELVFYTNPIAFGRGKSIFENSKTKMRFQLLSATSYECGVVILKYKPTDHSEHREEE